MKSREFRDVPDDHLAHQPYLTYQLTKADIIKLCVFMTPEEVYSTFKEGQHCPSPSTMRKICKVAKLGSRKENKEILMQCLLHYCPREEDLDDFELDISQWIAIAKCELIQEIRNKIVRQGSLWEGSE